VLLGELVYKIDQMDTGFRFMHEALNEKLVALDKKLNRVISGLDQTNTSLVKLGERVGKLEESFIDKILKVIFWGFPATGGGSIEFVKLYSYCNVHFSLVFMLQISLI